MDSINARFKLLRIECGKSQEEWGKILGLSKSGVSDIERGKRNVTKQHLIMLENWNERPINIEWLSSGNGEMFKRLNRKQEIAKLSADLFKSEDTSFKSRLIMALASMNEEEWEMLERIAKRIAEKKD